MVRKKCLFFLAASSPSASELTQVSQLGLRFGYDVQMRNSLSSALYGEKTEDADALILVPAVVSFAHGATLQLRLIKADFDEATGHISLTDVTQNSGTAYVSGTPAHMTVAATGLVTGVAAGVSIITATYTDANNNTTVATATLTAT